METAGIRKSVIHGFVMGLQKKLGSTDGTALIETALTLPLLLLLLTGSAEFARAGYAAIEVANAANAGVEYGTQSSAHAADTTGIQLAASDDAPDIALGTTSTTSSIACICSDGTTPSSCANGCSSSSAHLEQILTVQTQETYAPLIHWPGLPTTITLNGQAIRKVFQ
jgi:Flp pilus assembly protein TadG